MKKITYMILIMALSLQWSACSTSRATLDYNSLGSESKIDVKEGAVNGKSLGVAKGDAGGAIWADCTEKAQDSMRELLAQAKANGADAVGDIKWRATGNSEAGCKKGWGYLMVWPFVLTPLFMSTAVEGHMYKLDGGRRSGQIILPKSRAEEDRLVKKLVLGMKK